jgi:hypothetical protein
MSQLSLKAGTNVPLKRLIDEYIARCAGQTASSRFFLSQKPSPPAPQDEDFRPRKPTRRPVSGPFPRISPVREAKNEHSRPLEGKLSPRNPLRGPVSGFLARISPLRKRKFEPSPPFLAGCKSSGTGSKTVKRVLYGDGVTGRGSGFPLRGAGGPFRRICGRKNRGGRHDIGWRVMRRGPGLGRTDIRYAEWARIQRYIKKLCVMGLVPSLHEIQRITKTMLP